MSSNFESAKVGGSTGVAGPTRIYETKHPTELIDKINIFLFGLGFEPIENPNLARVVEVGLAQELIRRGVFTDLRLIDISGLADLFGCRIRIEEFKRARSVAEVSIHPAEADDDLPLLKLVKQANGRTQVSSDFEGERVEVRPSMGRALARDLFNTLGGASHHFQSLVADEGGGSDGESVLSSKSSSGGGGGGTAGSQLSSASPAIVLQANSVIFPSLNSTSLAEVEKWISAMRKFYANEIGVKKHPAQAIGSAFTSLFEGMWWAKYGAD